MLRKAVVPWMDVLHNMIQIGTSGGAEYLSVVKEVLGSYLKLERRNITTRAFTIL
jgi:hypothetical protein